MGWGGFICLGHPAGSCITSATSSEPVSLQCTALPLHTTELRTRVATPLLSLITVGKASYPIQAQECPPGLPFLSRSGKQDVIFIFSLSTKADHWSRWAQRVDGGHIHPPHCDHVPLKDPPELHHCNQHYSWDFLPAPSALGRADKPNP